MSKIVVLNAKGGCGKTTIATNLAAIYAVQGKPVALFDYDPQASSSYWLSLRPEHAPRIYGVEAYRPARAGVTRAWQWRLPKEVNHVIVDTPAAVHRDALAGFIVGADVVLIPVLPSAIDIHAATHFIQDMLQFLKLRRFDARVAVIGNRLTSTAAPPYQGFERFLASVNIPFLTSLRESTHYSDAVARGLSIHELGGTELDANLDCSLWTSILQWLGEGATRAGAAGRFAAAGRAEVVAAPVPIVG
jgi:chromosome partitioning protein